MPIFDIIHNLLLSLPKYLFCQSFFPKQWTKTSLIFLNRGMTKIGRIGVKQEQ